MRTVGICHFSYAGEGGFKVGHEDHAALEAFLYGEARMEERFRLFEAITLPCVARQTDPDFTFLIVTGTGLPAHHLARLQKLTSNIPKCVIKQYPPRPHRRIMKKAVNDWRGEPTEPCLQFKLDDDDAMALTFVEKFKQAAVDLSSITARHNSVAVDFNQGYVSTAGPKGVKLWAYHYAYSAIALGKIMPTLTLTGEDMMMRGHNGFNDSRLKGRKNVFDYQPMDAEKTAHIRTTFGINDDHVRSVFLRP